MPARPGGDATGATLVSMSDSDPSPPTGRVRREPPVFRPVAVRAIAHVTPRMIRITLAGPSLEGLVVNDPAASVRLLLPSSGRELTMPTWNGNEFLHADGKRPAIRTFTPGRTDAKSLELDLDVVVHEGGVASGWAEQAEPGDRAAVSGPGRGYAIDGEATAFLLAGDETAIPAIAQLLEALPAGVPVQVHIEAAHPDARLALPDHARTTVKWSDLPAGAPPGDTLVAAISGADLVLGIQVWAAGEAAAMQRIRRHLFQERSLPRAQATVRGYWKHGRTGDAEDG